MIDVPDSWLAALVEDPTRVGALADWCDETGDPERAAWAEFARKQVAKLECPQCNGRGTYSLHAAGGFGQRGLKCRKRRCVRLRRRERELIEDNWHRWTLPLREILRGVEGGDLGFNGHRIGVQLDSNPRNQAWLSFRHGLLHVEAPLGVLRYGLRRMGPQSAWVGSVRCTDREPYLWKGEGYWGRESWGSTTDALPNSLFDHLEGGQLRENSMMRYSSPDLAHAALNRAIVREAHAAVWPGVVHAH